MEPRRPLPALESEAGALLRIPRSLAAGPGLSIAGQQGVSSGSEAAQSLSPLSDIAVSRRMFSLEETLKCLERTNFSALRIVMTQQFGVKVPTSRV
ncbi:hypothetical protein STEG23_022154 [Scotinomys teguina]